jgi:putative ABC transport system substrate-binding protein
VRRREFIALAGGAAAWPLAARAQQAEQVRRIGVLLNLAARDPAAYGGIAVLTRTLQQLGWTEGRNLHIDYRWTTGDVSRIKADAVELVRLRPDAIFTGGSPGLIAAQQATRTIPIVFTNVADPVGQGFIESLARPGANATGFTNFEFAMGGKWLATLKDIAPRAARIALMVNPDNPNASIFLRSVETVAPSLGVETPATPVRNKTEIEGAFSALAGGSVEGLIVLPDGLALVHSQFIIDLAARYHLPVIYPFREFVDQGGLVSYGIKLSENYRQAADYVDRILRGANPAHLPVQAPTKFELVINLKTANTLGLDVPVQLQQLADEVIE